MSVVCPPKTIMLDVRLYLDSLRYQLAPKTISDKDFQELLHQLTFLLLNDTYQAALSVIGHTYPETNRMIDRELGNDAETYRKLCNGSRELLYSLWAKFNEIGVIQADGTIPYGIMKFQSHLALFDYFPH